jgi:hypothetical protein
MDTRTLDYVIQLYPFEARQQKGLVVLLCLATEGALLPNPKQSIGLA